MRKTLIALTAAATLILGACGDDGDDGDEAEEASDTTGTSTFEQTGPYAEFCTAVLQGAVDAAAGQASAPGGLPNVEAPPEVAEDWQVMRQIAERMGQLDSSAPDFQQRQEQLHNELGGIERLTQAQQNVTAFLTENCNLPNEESLTSTSQGG
jgi:hypothetical protein